MCELFLCDKRNLKGPVGQLHGLVEHKGRAGVVLLFDQELKALKEFIDLYILTFPRFSGKPYTGFQVKSIMDNREIRAFLFVDQGLGTATGIKEEVSLPDPFPGLEGDKAKDSEIWEPFHL